MYIIIPIISVCLIALVFLLVRFIKEKRHLYSVSFLHSLSLGVYIRNMSAKGKYVYVDDLAKTYYESKDIFTCLNWDQKQEDKLDKMVMDSGEELIYTKNVVSGNGVVDRILQITKRKHESSVITTLMDVTTLKRQENELIDTKLNLHLAIELADITSWIYDVTSNKIVTKINSGSILLPNASYENIKMAIADESREDFIAKFERLLSGQTQSETFMGVINNKRRKNKMYVECRMGSLTEPITGKVLKIAAALRDVTYQQSYEKELAEQNRKRGLVLKDSKFVHWDYDNRVSMFYYDKECKVFDGFSRSAQDFLENIHPDDLAIAMNFISDMNKSIDKDFDLNLRMRFEPEGEWRNSIINVIPLEYDSNQKVIRYTGSRQDITEFMKMSNDMVELSRKTQLVLDNLNSGMAYVTDDYRVQWENMSANMNFNVYEVGEFCYKNINNCNRPCDECIMELAIKHGKTTSKEIEISDGMIYEMCAVPLFEDGKSTGVILRVDNITERKRMFAELKQAKDRAESSDKLKSTFLANMSHEIRTPLNAIIGFSDLLTDCEDEVEKQEYREIIRHNNDLLLQLINDILDLSKMEAGYKDMSFQKFNMSGLFDELVITLGERFVNDKVKFVHHNPYANCLVTLDPKRVSQLITNFVSNAVKYTSQGYVKVSYEYADNGLMIKVKDTGTGIALDKQCKVFTRFEKLDSFAQGTGLGLSICKAITEAMHGKIGFESKEGVGSTFWVWLPTEAEIKVVE